MTPDEYTYAVAMAHRACRGWPLTRDDWEDIEQEAAIALWQGASSTRLYWAAIDAGIRIQNGGKKKVRPRPVSLEGRAAGEDGIDPAYERLLVSDSDPAAEVVETMTEEWVKRVLDLVRQALDEREWLSMYRIAEKRTWAEVCEELGTRHDGTVSLWRRQGLAKARAVLASKGIWADGIWADG